MWIANDKDFARLIVVVTSDVEDLDISMCVSARIDVARLVVVIAAKGVQLKKLAGMIDHRK